MNSRFFITLLFVVAVFFGTPGVASAQAKKASPSLKSTVVKVEDATASASATASAEITPQPMPIVRPDITQDVPETVEPLVKLLRDQEIGSLFPFNPLKYAIRNSVNVGVPVNTIVLLLLLPVVATVIAGARHVIGLRGFGLFLPAALSIVFLAIGPIVGIGLFMVIVSASMFLRIVFRQTHIRLQYLPRLAFILWFVVVGVLAVLLYLAPIVRHPDFTNVSIFPVLILVLLSEEFSKVQIGKSGRTAVMVTTETIILSLVSFMFLTLRAMQSWALLNPELLLLVVAIINYGLGKYVGLRFLEYWRFRKLIKS